MPKEPGIGVIYFSRYSDTIFLKPWWREGEIESSIQLLSCHVLLYLEYWMHKPFVASPGLVLKSRALRSVLCRELGQGVKFR